MVEGVRMIRHTMRHWLGVTDSAPAAPRPGFLGRLFGRRSSQPVVTPMAAAVQASINALPVPTTAMDRAPPHKLGLAGWDATGGSMVGANDAILGFFAGGAMPLNYHVLAWLSTHWLIDKACRMPARDAVRQGWIIGGDDEATTRKVQRADKAMRTAQQLEQFAHMGRVFGIRHLMFRVDSPEPGYYEHPFNPDGVTPGSYRGMVQIDPQWCQPDLTETDALDPTSPHFYEPTYWLVNGRRIHRSHLVIFRNGEMPDQLKPLYRYGSVSVPQRIVERVYSAERTANEAHQLALTKRVSIWKTDLAEAEMSDGTVERNIAIWRQFLDNYGVKLADKEGDDFQQFDTSLSDFDAVVMNAYQLVAAAAGVPATKLLGTTPKGFNATGEYEEAAYREELESIQTNDLTPVLDRHYVLLRRSLGLTESIEYTWEALDAPTAKEFAEIREINARTDESLQRTGAIDAVDVRARIRKDRDDPYFGIEEGTLDDPTDPLLTSPSTPTDGSGADGERGAG